MAMRVAVREWTGRRDDAVSFVVWLGRECIGAASRDGVFDLLIRTADGHANVTPGHYVGPLEGGGILHLEPVRAGR